MQTMTQHCTIVERFLFPADELSAGCDLDFDTVHDDLEREFQELRFMVGNNA